MSRTITVPRRARLAGLPMVAALALAGCAAGSHSPQYEEHTTSDYVNTDLPGGLALDGGMITTPGSKGGHAVATFTVGVLTGDGATITGVSSPVAGTTELGLVSGSRAAPVSSISVQPSQSQVPVRVIVVLDQLTQDLRPGHFYDLQLTLAQSATPVTLQFPVLRAGANPGNAVLPTAIS